MTTQYENSWASPQSTGKLSNDVLQPSVIEVAHRSDVGPLSREDRGRPSYASFAGAKPSFSVALSTKISSALLTLSVGGYG
jgi:hypothetical protein